MPCLRSTSAVFAPASCSCKIPTICSSVNRPRFIVRTPFQVRTLTPKLEEFYGLRSPPMITLYHSPMTRSSSIVWLLEELGVPYETKIVGFRRFDGTGEKDP